jgi:hypothetical protein
MKIDEEREILVEDLLYKPTSDLITKKLVKQLKQKTEEERLEFILKMLSYRGSYGLVIALKTLQKAASFKVLLEMGIKEGDASNLGYWLQYTLPRLGFRRTVSILKNKLDEDPLSIYKAFYWLSRMTRNISDREREDFEDLRSELIKRGFER